MARQIGERFLGRVFGWVRGNHADRVRIACERIDSPGRRRLAAKLARPAPDDAALARGWAGERDDSRNGLKAGQPRKGRRHIPARRLAVERGECNADGRPIGGSMGEART